MKRHSIFFFVVFVVASLIFAFFSYADSTTSRDRASTRFGKIGEYDKDEFVFPIAENLNLILTPNESGLMVRGLDFPPPENADLRPLANNSPIRPQELFSVKGVKEIIVPEEINGLKVTEIGEQAFRNGCSVERIVLPKTVVKIGPYAFSHCISLRDIVLPNNLSKLEEGAFIYCESLEELTLPQSMAEIGSRAFETCRSLKTINFVGSVRVIGRGAFRNCLVLETIILPDSVEKIEQSAFSDCPKLKSINIPSSLEEIPYSFLASSGVKEITIPDSVKTIHSGAFASSKIEKIEIGTGVENIEANAFQNLANLKSLLIDPGNSFFNMENNALVTKDGTRLIATFPNETRRRDLPQGLVRIDDGAFSNEKPAVITIPASVREIGEFAFVDRGYTLGFLPGPPDTALTIIVDEDNPDFKSVDGALLTKDGKRYIQAPLGREEEYIIPEGVETINGTAFVRAAFKKITIPGSVKVVERRAFESLANLEEVVIEEGVEEILENAFPPSDVLKTVLLPKSVERMATVNPNKVMPHVFPEHRLRNPFGNETILRVPKGSYAEKWAIEQKMKYETID